MCRSPFARASLWIVLAIVYFAGEWHGSAESARADQVSPTVGSAKDTSASEDSEKQNPDEADESRPGVDDQWARWLATSPEAKQVVEDTKSVTLARTSLHFDDAGRTAQLIVPSGTKVSEEDQARLKALWKDFTRKHLPQDDRFSKLTEEEKDNLEKAFEIVDADQAVAARWKNWLGTDDAAKAVVESVKTIDLTKSPLAYSPESKKYGVNAAAGANPSDEERKEVANLWSDFARNDLKQFAPFKKLDDEGLSQLAAAFEVRGAAPPPSTLTEAELQKQLKRWIESKQKLPPNADPEAQGLLAAVQKAAVINANGAQLSDDAIVWTLKANAAAQAGLPDPELEQARNAAFGLLKLFLNRELINSVGKPKVDSLLPNSEARIIFPLTEEFVRSRWKDYYASLDDGVKDQMKLADPGAVRLQLDPATGKISWRPQSTNRGLKAAEFTLVAAEFVERFGHFLTTLLPLVDRPATADVRLIQLRERYYLYKEIWEPAFVAAVPAGPFFLNRFGAPAPVPFALIFPPERWIRHVVKIPKPESWQPADHEELARKWEANPQVGSRLLLGRALDSYWKGDYSDAIPSLDAALILEPAFPVAMAFKALTHYKAGETEDAEAARARLHESLGGLGLISIGNQLERIQGADRMWLEKF